MSEDGEQPPGGRLIDGRYQLVERIGSGGVGTVWRALDKVTDGEVAVKQPRLARDPGDPEHEEHRRAVNRLYHEARVAARVVHPSAITIQDVVVEDGTPWIVMEFIRGESLDELLRRGPLQPAEAARIGLAVLGALRAAHAVGIVHRDVKLANVLLGPDGRVVLTDFGIAHVRGEEPGGGDGEFTGPPEFVAPEQLSEFGAGPASDLWSLGALLYAAVEGAPPPRRTVVESAPPGPLGPLIVRLLAQDPGERPDAVEAGVVLSAVAGVPDVPALPDTPDETPPNETDVTDTPEASEAGNPPDAHEQARYRPLRRLLTGLGLSLPPAREQGGEGGGDGGDGGDGGGNPDRRPSIRAIR